MLAWREVTEAELTEYVSRKHLTLTVQDHTMAPLHDLLLIWYGPKGRAVAKLVQREGRTTYFRKMEE